MKDKKKIGDLLLKFGSGLKDFSIAATQAHPVVLCVGIMGGIVVAKFIMGKERPETAHLHGHLNRFYDASQSIALACATAPVIAGGLSLVGGYLAQTKAAK